MCVVCGCGGDGTRVVEQGPQVRPQTGDLDFGAGAARVTVPGMSQERTIRLEADVLEANNAVAKSNRAHFAAHGVAAYNLMSSPGSGKTTLLCATIAALKSAAPQVAVAVIEGDQQTSVDAERIRATGAPAIQVNTGRGCHLDAPMVAQAFARLDLHAASHHEHGHDHGHEHAHARRQDGALQPGHELAGGDRALLFIENVGNLVCPALWDLGEAAKVVILSVTEGDDKPLKYPDMFAASTLMVLNKIDLLPYVSFDVARCKQYALRLNPGLSILELSATTGQGMQAWLDWLLGRSTAAQPDVVQLRIAQLEAELSRLRASQARAA